MRIGPSSLVPDYPTIRTALRCRAPTHKKEPINAHYRKATECRDAARFVRYQDRKDGGPNHVCQKLHRTECDTHTHTYRRALHKLCKPVKGQLWRPEQETGQLGHSKGVEEAAGGEGVRGGGGGREKGEEERDVGLPQPWRPHTGGEEAGGVHT